MILKRVGLATAVAVLLALPACSSGNGGSKAAPTTARPGRSIAPYAGPGPYAVGYTTLHLAHGRRVVVWYPAAPGSTAGHPRETVDVASFLTPTLQAAIPPGDRPQYPANAYRDAPAAPHPGGYPVVLFSHGFAGFPEQSLDITTHLASWGYVVVAPTHVERSLDGLLGTASQGVPKSTDVAVLKQTLDLVEQASSAPGVLQGTVNPSLVAVTGHSAGADAAYLDAAADPRVKAWISYAVGFEKDGTTTQKVPLAAHKPGMVMLGTADGIIPPTDTRQVFAAMHSPKYLVSVPGAGHLVFSDLCLVGSSKGGIVHIAQALKLPIPPSLLKLGTDGCGASYPPVTRDFPAIDQLSVAFLRSAFHQDTAPTGLSTAAVAPLGGGVTVQSG